MYNPLMSFLKPQRFFGGGGGGGGGSDDSGSSSSTGYTSISDMFDGGGAGGSGDSFFSGSHDDYVSSGGTGGVSHSSSNNDNDDNDNSTSTSTSTSADTSGNSGYTSLTDMFDGGGAGGSGSEFFTGSHEDYEQTEAGIADAASDAAGTTNYEGGTYTGVTDMIDGGGPGQSGNTFEGPLSDISTGIGATPLGSGIEPTGVADFVASGGITGLVLNTIMDGVDALGGASSSGEGSGSTGYTGFTDMIDGGGPGQSGDEFGGALGGVSNALGLSPLGSGDDSSDDSSEGNSGYTSIRDFIDGGGPGFHGDTFGGALGGVSNAIGLSPLGGGNNQGGGAEEGNSGYTSITDMLDGGGPGQSGDTFGGLLGGITNALPYVEPLGSADEPGFLSSITGYGYYDENGVYVPATVDLIDGGGAGESGDQFEGLIGDLSNAVGATPYESNLDPTGVAGVVNDVVTGTGNAVEGIVGSAVDAVSDIFTDNTTNTTNTTNNYTTDDSTTDNSVLNTTNNNYSTYNTVPNTIQLLDPVRPADYIETSNIGDYTTLSVGQPGGGATNFNLDGVGQPGGIVNSPAGTMSYLPSEGLMALQNLYANAASQQAPVQQATFGFPGQQNLFPSLVLPQLNSQQQNAVVDPYGLFQFNQRLV